MIDLNKLDRNIEGLTIELVIEDGAGCLRASIDGLDFTATRSIWESEACLTLSPQDFNDLLRGALLILIDRLAREAREGRDRAARILLQLSPMNQAEEPEENS